MRIAVDAAGCEPGTPIVVEGVFTALKEFQASNVRVRPAIYGPANEIRTAIEAVGGSSRLVDVVDTTEVIEMNDRPSEAILTKRDSSIVRGILDLSEGLVDAFVSMGNTGAVVGASRAYLGKLRWINKPALGVPLPRRNGMNLMLDAGAVSDPKPGHMLQFAAMGAAFVEKVYGVSNPRVGLMNIGTESHKGNERTRDAYKQLTRSQLNFIGNIEGGDLFRDVADVIVTDGFVGNILLKFSEAIPEIVTERLDGTDLYLEKGNGPLGDLDYRRYGGATLLGVDGAVVIGHGRSTAQAVAQALRWSSKMVRGKVIDAMKDKVFKARASVLLSNPFARGDGSDDA